MEDCIFCKIVKKEIEKEIEKETENFIVFKDIKPSAQTHLLLVSKKHIDNVDSMPSQWWKEIKDLAFYFQKNLKLDEFQIRVNWGKLLEINHLHFHFMSELFH